MHKAQATHISLGNGHFAWQLADGRIVPDIRGGAGIEPVQTERPHADLDDSAITSRLEQIDEEVDELLAGEATDDTASRIESLADEADELRAEQGARQEAAAERQARIEAAAARHGRGNTAEDGEDVDGEIVAEDGGEGEGEDGEGAEGTEAEGDGEDGEDGEGEGAEAPQAIAATTTPAATATASTGRGVTRTTPRSAAALAGKRPKSAKPKAQRTSETLMRASAHAVVPEGRELRDTMSIADQIVKKAGTFSRGVPAGVRDYLPIASGVKDIPSDRFLSPDAQENFGLIRDARESIRGGAQALVASGGICAPFSPIYEFFRLAEPQNPIEDALPTTGAPRGGIRFIVPPDFRDAAGAIGETTAAQDAAGYESNGGDTPDKPCITVECPAVDEVSVTAISQCVTFGNLQYRTFPEQVAAFLEDVAVAFSLTKEALYWNRLVAGSTEVESAMVYGASRSLLWDWTTTAVQYRKRANMRRDSTLQVIADDWALDLIKLDMAMDSGNGLNFFNITDGEVNTFLRNRGLDVAWRNDVDTTANGIAAAQAEGELNPWPSDVEAIFYAPGTFVRLDGGTLDVGLVRDSVLNRTNDLELFMEEWVEVAKVGIEAIHLHSQVCPSGAAPELVTVLNCAAGSGIGAG